MSSLQRPELRGTRVLVVDDDADNREMLAMILEHSGAVVATAASAAEALRVLESAHSQVLISDIGLPDEDGYCLLTKVRALSKARGGDIPAIALSGYGRDEGRGARGFQAHLTKPVTPEKILATIAHLLQPGPGP